MIALGAGCVLVGITSVCFAALMRVRGAVSFALALAVLSFAEVVAVSHVLSFVDAYERSWFLIAVGAVAASAIVVVAFVRPPSPDLPRASVARHLAGDPVIAVLSAVVAAELVYLLALALFTPPTEYDALTYHLTRAILWIQQGSVGGIPGVADTRINDLPPDAEIAQGATMLLSGSIRFVGLVQLASLLVAVVAIYGSGCRIGLERRQAAFGALVFPTLTVVALQAPTALNDLVVAALAVTAAFFALGRLPAEAILGGVTVALLVGTKATGLLVVPVLLVLCLVMYRGAGLIVVLGIGAAAVAVGSAWYVLEDSPGGESHGAVEGPVAIAARATRYMVETLELPAAGKDVYVYAVVAAALAAGGLALRLRTATVLGATLLALLPLAVPTLERAMHAVYWHGWTFFGYAKATSYGTIRGASSASNLESWYGPVGLALTLASLVLVTRAVHRETLPWAAVVLAVAPIVALVGTAVIVGYHAFDGRYVMGGVALGATTWGVVRLSPAASAAAAAVAAATAFLALVTFAERPAGIRLLEPAAHPSIWTLPRAWSQSIQPEVSVVIEYLDSHARPGSTIALTRDRAVYPFAYVGWPSVDHRIAYADTLTEATAQSAAWAVLPAHAACAPGWRLALPSTTWVVYRHVPGDRCR